MNTGTTCAAGELDLADLKAADLVRIETRNNIYEFLVSDPVMSCGVVRGGTFGADVVAAVLICNSSKLKVGGRARLLTKSGDRCEFVTTSTITNLTHTESY